jgi:hypothetical protein
VCRADIGAPGEEAGVHGVVKVECVKTPAAETGLVMPMTTMAAPRRRMASIQCFGVTMRILKRATPDTVRLCVGEKVHKRLTTASCASGTAPLHGPSRLKDLCRIGTAAESKGVRRLSA